jgi:predicted small integral membrane protein
MKPLIDIEELDDEAKVVETPREGFLPIHTNGFDRGFIGVILFIAIHLFWLRFVEWALPLPVATVLSVALAIYIIARG